MVTLTKEILLKLKPETLRDIHNVTGLLELEAGLTPSDLQGLQIANKYGLQAYLVNPLASPEKDSVKTTSDTYCRNSLNWSDSQSLSDCLANRLRQRLNTVGSTIYKQQWKQKVTPSGLRYWAHTASARSTRDKGCIGWPTTTTRDHKDGSYCPNVPINSLLGRTVWLAAWASPTVTDANRGVKPPRPHDTGVPLTQQVGQILTGSNAETTSSGQLNPDLSRWLMGFPQEWCDCAVTATQSFLK